MFGQNPNCLPTGPPGAPPLPYPVDVREVYTRKNRPAELEKAPAGRYEVFTYSHPFDFVQEVAAGLQAIEVQQHIFEVGDQADFIWTGFAIWGNNAGAPEVAAAATDPVANCRVGFFTHHGTRPLQSSRVRASLYLGTGLDGSADTAFRPPYLFPQPLFLPVGETVRIDMEHRRPETTRVVLALLGYRWYAGK